MTTACFSRKNEVPRAVVVRTPNMELLATCWNLLCPGDAPAAAAPGGMRVLLFSVAEGFSLSLGSSTTKPTERPDGLGEAPPG